MSQKPVVTEPEKPRKVAKTDETLRIVAKVDRLLAEVPEHMREWAIGWLQSKWTPDKRDTKPCES